MLDLLSSGLISLGLPMMGVEARAVETYALLAVGKGWTIPTLPESELETIVDDYLAQLETQGKVAADQGIWMQSGVQTPIDRRGTSPRPAASITKIATTLTALKQWEIDRQFETLLSARGTVENGVVRGDLVIEGGSDPLFVWKEAIAVGNTLEKMGIRRITGDLIVTGAFALNFETDPQAAGQRLKEALNSEAWSPEVQAEYEKLPPGTPKPTVKIEGTVRRAHPTADRPNLWGRQPETVPLLRHQSLPLVSLLKEMNVESNNEMAQMLADALGGAAVVAETAVREAGFPPSEIQLINGSGLGQENRISPRAACAMFVAIQRHLLPLGMNVGDVFPVMGRDIGTLEDRTMPAASVVKTGTLWDVSALVGVLPTRDRGLVWFAIVNGGGDYVENFRARQDLLLHALQKHWGGKPQRFPPLATTPTTTDLDRFGAIERNQILWGG